MRGQMGMCEKILFLVTTGPGQVLNVLDCAKKFSLLHSSHSMKGPQAPFMSLTSPFPIFFFFFLQNKIQTERQKIVSEFQLLQQFLEEQERLLMAHLEKLDKEIMKIENENVTKLSEEISRLSELISEIEGKYQKPASEFLQVRLS
ncbi:unnamed protein product [Eretmochelys imbricata]